MGLGLGFFVFHVVTRLDIVVVVFSAMMLTMLLTCLKSACQHCGVKMFGRV